jgi:hypothetical protein
MVENKNMPQMEAEQADKSATAERYVVYMRSIRKLKMSARAKADRMNTDGAGGTGI